MAQKTLTATHHDGILSKLVNVFKPDTEETLHRLHRDQVLDEANAETRRLALVGEACPFNRAA